MSEQAVVVIGCTTAVMREKLQMQFAQADYGIDFFTTEQLPNAIHSGRLADDFQSATLGESFGHHVANQCIRLVIVFDESDASDQPHDVISLSARSHVDHVLHIVDERNSYGKNMSARNRAYDNKPRENMILVRHAPQASTENETGHAAEIARLACYLASEEANDIRNAVIPVIRGRYLV